MPPPAQAEGSRFLGNLKNQKQINREKTRKIAKIPKRIFS
jgi:hypothetical protein